MNYIALLRGVNVGGNNKVPMPALKKCFADAGFQNVMTYINSGNVIFDSEERAISELTAYCETILQNTFGFEIGLAVVRPAQDIFEDALVENSRDRVIPVYHDPQCQYDEKTAGTGSPWQRALSCT